MQLEFGIMNSWNEEKVQLSSLVHKTIDIVYKYSMYIHKRRHCYCCCCFVKSTQMQIFTLEHQRRTVQCDAVRLLSSHCGLNWFKNVAGNIYLKISNKIINLTGVQIMHCAIKLLKISMCFFSPNQNRKLVWSRRKL